MAVGRAQVPGSNLDLRLSGSEIILKWPGSQEAAQLGAPTQEAEKACETRHHEGLWLPIPGAGEQGWAAQVSTPRGKPSQPGAAWGGVEALRRRSPPPGPSARGEASSSRQSILIQAWGLPLPGLLAQHLQVWKRSAQRTRGGLAHASHSGGIQCPSPCPSACPGAGVTIRISQVMHSPRAHGSLAELLSPGSRPQAPCCGTSSGSGHWHESWLRKAVCSGTMLPGKSTKRLFFSFSKRLPVRKGAPSLHLAARPLDLPLGTLSPQPPWSASQTS